MNIGKRIIGTGLAALATLGLAAPLHSALAADAANASQPMAWHHGGGGAHGRGAEGAMMHVLHELNLSDAQKQQVHTLLSSARAQWQAQSGSAVDDLAALGNPGDPNHAAAVQAAQARAAQRIQNWSEVQQQVYAVLTPAQQAQLPQLLAQWQSQAAERRSTHKADTPQ